MEEEGGQDYLQVPSFNTPMTVELNEDPWKPMATRRRYSDTGSSLAAISNGHIDHIPNENYAQEKDEYGMDDENIRSYKRRFYILLVFSLSAFAQYCAWNAFGPISGTVKAVFGWGNAEIALLASLDPITYLLTMIFFSWMMDVKGLRVSLVLSVFLMFIGTGLRCVTSDHSTALWTMTAGQFLNGLAGPVTQAAPPLLSSAWFPRSERTTATAVASLCGSLGVALSFVIGPNMVGGVDLDNFQTSPSFSQLTSNSSFLSKDLFLNNSTPLSETLYRDAVHYWSMDEIIQPSPQTSNDNLHYIKDAKSDLRGTLRRTAHVTGQVEKALELNGNGFIDLGNFVNTCLGKPSSCRNGMTVSLWLKYKPSEKRQYFLGTSGTDIKQPGFVIYQDLYSNGSNYIAVSVRTGKAAWTTHVTVPTYTWTHVLFSWSSRDGLSVHTNGTLASRVEEFSPTDSIENFYTVLTLGRPNNEYRLSRATYDELAVWYLVLTEQEAKAIFARSSGTDFAALDARVTKEKNDLLQKREDEIMRLLYIEFGVIAVLFVCTAVYFPSKPPTPPSLSSATEREDFSAGFKQLLRHKQFWTLAMIYGITTGIYSGWGALLALNLEGFNIGQNQAGWIGFYATIAGISAGILLARFSDFFGGNIKRLLLFLFVCSSASFLWFSLLCLRIIPFSEASLYPSSIIGGFSISGTIPLFYELTVECTYPISEGVTTGVLTLVNNIWTVIFLLVVMIPGIGTIWMNWALFASCAGCIPILLMFKERYGRLIVDAGIEVKVANGSDDELEDDGFKTRRVFASTLSMAGVDQFMDRLHKSKESKL
ncbi:solute carrier family 49 member 4-like isoform X2 [Dendronephthya gigantea]|nr:solute carrier family 49 member 4-like isoform X2 [Dendronephthya gigantea]